MPTMTVGGTGDDRRSGAVEREGHRLVPVLMTAELFPISGGEQQRVVRAGAETRIETIAWL